MNTINHSNNKIELQYVTNKEIKCNYKKYLTNAKEGIKNKQTTKSGKRPNGTTECKQRDDGLKIKSMIYVLQYKGAVRLIQK